MLDVMEMKMLRCGVPVELRKWIGFGMKGLEELTVKVTE